MNMPPQGSLQKVRFAAGIVAATVLVLASLGWLFAEHHVFPSYRARLYRVPIANIQAIRIDPGNNFPLVDHEVVITNSAMIQQVMSAIRAAPKYFPNHPSTRWSCGLAISSLSGTSYVDVSESYGQGTILYCATSSGLYFDTLQSSTLGQILEQATAQKR
jgi:hypothetical protein